MTRDPAGLWLSALAASAGFAGVDEFADAYGLRPYRLRQLYRAACKELVGRIADVTPWPKDLRETVSKTASFDSLLPGVVQHSRDGQTTKALFRLRDSKEVEAVLMEHSGGRTTVCISSQAGCAFACAFCSTGQAGFGRNLRAVEIFDQARFFARELAKRSKRVTNVVFMGMGEPFHNYDAVMEAVALLNDPAGFGLGHRHITISTVGLVDKIDRFADEHLQVNLAISLHAPSDDVRSQMMPVNRRFSVSSLMAACERYVEKTNRKVFFEYVMLQGVNDSIEMARRLGELMRGRLYHVNLIPYNTTPDGPFLASSESHIWRFAGVLAAAGVPTTVRRNMGRDIAAACGQLRAQARKNEERLSNPM